MDVKNTATAAVSLKVIARYRPFGSQAKHCGRPPTSVGPTDIFERSATGKASLGTEEAENYINIISKL